MTTRPADHSSANRIYTLSAFPFLAPTALRDGDLTVALAQTLSADASPWLVPAYVFHLRHADIGEHMGRLSLRFGGTERITHHAGHVGYAVEPAFRGRRYAERACRLVLPVLRHHGIDVAWLTCAPDNAASVRTMERLGAEYVETVTVPDDYPMPARADRRKRRYRLRLDGAAAP